MADDPSSRRTTVTFTQSLKPPSLIHRPSTGGTTTPSSSEVSHAASRPATPTKSSKWKDRCKKFLGLSTKAKKDEPARGRTRERGGAETTSTTTNTFDGASGMMSYNEAAAASLPDIVGARKWRRPSPFPHEKRPEPTRSKTAPQIHVSPPQATGSSYQRKYQDSDGTEWLRDAGR